MTPFEHWDIFTLVLMVTSIGTLGLVVFWNNTRNITNRAFFFFAIMTILWGTTNYISYQLSVADLTLWILRLAIFFAVWHAYSFFLLVNVFPKEELGTTKLRKVLFLLTTITSLINLSPFVFTKIEKMGVGGLPSTATQGPLIPLFGITVILLVFGGIFILVKHFRNAVDTERAQLRLVLIGSCLTFALILFFNFILPTVFDNVGYIPLGGFYVLPLITFAAYAIYKHHLFNLKLVATKLFVGIICVLFFSRIIIAQTMSERLLDCVIFITTVFFGVLLVRSVEQEIKAREEIATLARRLTETNYDLARANEQLKILDQRKSEFVSLVSHQLRAPITAINGYTSMLLENSYGKLTAKVREPIERVFLSSRRMVEMVSEFLNITKIEQGTMTYVLAPVDVGKIVLDVTTEFASPMKQKGLVFNLKIPKKGKLVVFADEGKIRQVISNLIDNSIKYTPRGSLSVSVGEDAVRHTVTIRIKDTGIGLSRDNLEHIFGKFTRGKEGAAVNATGSGLGLYVAKKMIEAQKGKIWAESDGPGKGSTFMIELSTEGK